ncbi:hypothetical protein D3C84_467430 [compost metagenome]
MTHGFCGGCRAHQRQGAHVLEFRRHQAVAGQPSVKRIGVGNDAAHVPHENGFAVVNPVRKRDGVGVHQAIGFVAGISWFQQRTAEPKALTRILFARTGGSSVRVEYVLVPALRFLVIALFAQAMGNQERQVKEQLPVKLPVGTVEIDNGFAALWPGLKGVLSGQGQDFIDGDSGLGHQFRTERGVEAYPFDPIDSQRPSIQKLRT